MIKNNLLIAFFILFCANNFVAQNNNVMDSLKNQIKLAKDDTSKINTMIELGEYYYNNLNIEEAQVLFSSSFNLSQKVNFSKGKIYALYNLSGIYSKKGKLDSAFTLAKKAVSISKEGKRELYAYALINLSENFLQQSQLDSSMYYAHLARKNAKGKYLVYALSSIGHIYSFKDNYDSSFHYHFKALKLCENESKEIKSEVLLGLSSTFQSIKDTANSKKYLLEYLSLMDDNDMVKLNTYYRLAMLEKDVLKRIQYAKKGYDLGVSKGLNYYSAYYAQDIAKEYEVMDKIDSAIYYYELSIEYFKRDNNQAGLLDSYLGLANTFLSKDFNKSEELVYKALDVCQGKYPVITQSAYFLLYVVYRKKNDYKKALQFYEKYDLLTDSLFNETKHKQIAELETKYQTEKKEAENKELVYQNKLVEQEKQNEKQKSSFYLWGGIGLVSLLSLGGFLFYRQRKIRFENNQYKLEQKLLRSQMNPHFMSNFLMAVKNSIKQETPEKAIENMDKFGVLSRQVLEASINDFILLEDEISFIKNYLSLQQLVSHNKFTFNVELLGDIDETEIMIPPMLIQPFIENAIEHGFRGMEEKGDIQVNFSLQNNQIIAEVIDNGVGITKQAEIKGKKHQSRSTQIINDRITLFKKKWNKDIIFDIIELNIGTKVIFKLPIKDVVFN